MPHSWHLACSVSSTPALMARIGSRKPICWRRMRVASKPSMTGICTSISTRSNAAGSARSRSTAWRPCSATVTTAPLGSSTPRATTWLVGLSSTSRMRAPRSTLAGAAGATPSPGCARLPWRRKPCSSRRMAPGSTGLASAAASPGRPGRSRLRFRATRHRPSSAALPCASSNTESTSATSQLPASMAGSAAWASTAQPQFRNCASR